MRDQEIVQAKDITTPIPLPHLLIGIVLAGGQSSRMGRDKALLTLRGKTFLSLARQALFGLGCARVVMSGAPRAEWNGQHVPDMMANMGPVGGMVPCIAHWRMNKTLQPMKPCWCLWQSIPPY